MAYVENNYLNGVRLLLLGFITLFLELALIRYLGGTIWNLGYFPNFVLLSVFIGMGIGFMFHHYISGKNSIFFFHLSFFLLMILIIFVYYKHPSLPLISNEEEKFGEFYFINKSQDTDFLPFFICFIVIIFLFALISQRTAKLFKLFNPLKAYTLDIVGSCLGILSFMMISFFQVPPYIWFFIFTILFIITLPKSFISILIPSILSLIVIFHAYKLDTKHLRYPDYKGKLEVIWSPYQRVEYIDDETLPLHLRKTIWVNGIGHQRIALDKEELLKGYYMIPYYDRRNNNFSPYKNVLIIGSGSGNDTAVAILNNAQEIDAVEIDPVIAKYGSKYHPLSPYQDKRVNLVVDDGRSFMTHTREKYDLIIFAWADSLVRVSSLSQLRLENYLFTEESIQRAYKLLTDDGCIYIFNSFPQSWTGEKLVKMIYNATNKYPKILHSSGGEFAFLKIGNAPYCQSNEGKITEAEPPTDDWPFLHLKKRSIPDIYKKMLFLMITFIVILTAFMHFSTQKKENYKGLKVLFLKISFTLMGGAFMLLETKSIIQFSLLFGNTWLNNSLVFLGILILVLIANWIAYFIKNLSFIKYISVILIVSTLIPLFYPLNNLLSIENIFSRFILASLLTFSPIFFANLIFSLAFKDQVISEHIFGWNLIGASIGGLLEYFSLVLGYNMLAILVGISYLFVIIMLIKAKSYEMIPNRS